MIDLVRMKLLTFPEKNEGRTVSVAEVPDELRDEAGMWRSELLESLYNFSNELMELALSEEPISITLS